MSWNPINLAIAAQVPYNFEQAFLVPSVASRFISITEY
jgi:hypothetical protein